MRKVDNGENGGKQAKIMIEIAATNVVASGPPECRPQIFFYRVFLVS